MTDVIRTDCVAFERDNVLAMARDGDVVRVWFKGGGRDCFLTSPGDEGEKIWTQYVNPPFQAASPTFNPWLPSQLFGSSSPMWQQQTAWPITPNALSGSAMPNPGSMSPLTIDDLTPTGFSSYSGRQPNGYKSTGMTGETTSSEG